MNYQSFAGKIRNIKVTSKELQYDGSVLVSRALLDLASIPPFAQVWVSNLTTGVRWLTYVLPTDEPGVFGLRGGETRYGEVGDDCVIIFYREVEKFEGAKVVFCGAQNTVKEIKEYDPQGNCDVIARDGALL